MNMTARNLPGADPDTDTDIDQTVFFPNQHPAQVQAVGPDPGHPPHAAGRPAGSPEMPPQTPGPQAQGRFTFSSGARPLDGYTIKRAIGRGGFGEVYYATSDSGKEVALKLILRNLDVESRGVKQCMNLKCPNLLAVYNLETTPAGDSFVLMEYVAGPSLAQVLARHPNGLPPAEASAWLKGLVDGVAYLHDHGIVHRDLKPANLFMEEGTVKIGDYGLAKLITPSAGSEHSESIGTCHYMAPEIASGKYSRQIDIYAIGVILYEMLTGRVPFEGETVGEVLMKHLTARPDLSPLPQPYRGIVEKALAKAPEHRQQRVFDMLPPSDAPRSPNVRFIGDGKVGPTLPDASPDDDVLRIGAEEPVFYIGPDTRPPRQPLGQRLRAAWQRPAGRPAPPPVRTPVTATRPQPPRPQPQQVRRPQPPKPQPVALTPVPPPQPPPPLPGARVRVAELTGSMLWAAPTAAALSVIAAAILGVDMTARPEQVAYLFGTSLLAAWGAMLPGKVFEGRKAPALAGRAAYAVTGALVGLGSWALAASLDLLGPLPSAWSAVTDPAFREVAGAASSPTPVGLATYFALVFLTAGWPRMTDRNRSRRTRIYKAGRAAVLAGLIGLLWPSPQPWELAAVAVTALVVQSASPWSELGSAHARYAAKLAKAEAKAKSKAKGRKVA